MDLSWVMHFDDSLFAVAPSVKVCCLLIVLAFQVSRRLGEAPRAEVDSHVPPPAGVSEIVQTTLGGNGPQVGLIR